MKTILKLIMILVTDLLFYQLYNKVDVIYRFMTAWGCGAINIALVFFINALFEHKEEDIES